MKKELIALLCRKSFKYSETPAFQTGIGSNEPLLRELQAHHLKPPRHVSDRPPDVRSHARQHEPRLLAG